MLHLVAQNMKLQVLIFLSWLAYFSFNSNLYFFNVIMPSTTKYEGASINLLDIFSCFDLKKKKNQNL